jgi:hypothetical protein
MTPCVTTCRPFLYHISHQHVKPLYESSTFGTRVSSRGRWTLSVGEDGLVGEFSVEQGQVDKGKILIRVRERGAVGDLGTGVQRGRLGTRVLAKVVENGPTCVAAIQQGMRAPTELALSGRGDQALCETSLELPPLHSKPASPAGEYLPEPTSETPVHSEAERGLSPIIPSRKARPTRSMRCSASCRR